MRHWLVCTAVIAVITGAALGDGLTQQQIANFASPQVWRGVMDKHPALLVRWVNDARALLGDSDLERATHSLSGKYGLPTDQMANLLRLWILSQQEDRTRTVDEQRALNEGWMRLAQASRYQPLVLEAAAKAMDNDNWASDAALFAQLVGNAPDPVAAGWHVVRYHQSSNWLGWLLDHAGERRFVPLAEALHDINLKPEDSLPIHDWLTSPAGLVHVAAPDREAVAIKLTADYATALWKAGLIDDGIKAFERLPQASRDKLLAADIPERTAHADGLEFDLGGTEAETFRFNFAAALTQQGRLDEARRILARSTALAKAQKYLACHPADARNSWGDPCGDPDRTFAMAMLLDATIGGGGDRLGTLAQTFFTDGGLVPNGILWTELSCRAFRPRFAKVCTDLRLNLGNMHEPLGEPYGLAATAAVRSLPGFAASRARLYAATDRAHRQWEAPPADRPKGPDCADGVSEMPFFGKMGLGPGQPGQPISYRDPQTGTLLYVESDGRHLTAIGPDGVLKWVRDPFADAHLCPYRTARPVIARIEPAVDVEPSSDRQWPPKKMRIVILQFDSSQFGAIDLETGDFTPMGRN